MYYKGDWYFGVRVPGSPKPLTLSNSLLRGVYLSLPVVLKPAMLEFVVFGLRPSVLMRLSVSADPGVA